MPPQQTQIAIPMLVTTPKTKSFYQVMKITPIPVMVFQHQLIRQTLDAVRPLIGQEREALDVLQISTMVTIGLVLLTAPTSPARGVSVIAVISTSTAVSSTIRTSVCAPAFQSILRSSRSNNQNHQSPPLIESKEAVK